MLAVQANSPLRTKKNGIQVFHLHVFIFDYGYYYRMNEFNVMTRDGLWLQAETLRASCENSGYVS